MGTRYFIEIFRARYTYRSASGKSPCNARFSANVNNRAIRRVAISFCSFFFGRLRAMYTMLKQHQLYKKMEKRKNKRSKSKKGYLYFFFR
jgi:hypothetical protein